MRGSSTATSQDALLAPRSRLQAGSVKPGTANPATGAAVVVSSGPMPLPSPFASRQEQVSTGLVKADECYTVTAALQQTIMLRFCRSDARWPQNGTTVSQCNQCARWVLGLCI